jgi:hypothetical protein
MSIKIPSGPKETGPIDAAEEVRESVESTAETPETGQVTSTTLDPIGQIAERVAAGEIGRDQAIDLILSEVLNSNMLKAAPKEVLGELEEVLRAALDTDPQLTSLRSFLSSIDNS